MTTLGNVDSHSVRYVERKPPRSKLMSGCASRRESGHQSGRSQSALAGVQLEEGRNAAEEKGREFERLEAREGDWRGRGRTEEMLQLRVVEEELRGRNAELERRAAEAEGVRVCGVCVRAFVCACAFVCICLLTPGLQQERTHSHAVSHGEKEAALIKELVSLRGEREGEHAWERARAEAAERLGL